MKRNTTTENASMRFVTITKSVPLRKPKLSNKMPATDGPMKAPRANVEVHIPDTKPYVAKLLGKP